MKFSYNGFVDRLIASAGDTVLSYARDKVRAWRNRGWYSVEMDFDSDVARGIILLADKSEEAKDAKTLRVDNYYNGSIGEHADAIGPAPDGFVFTIGGVKCQLEKSVEGSGEDTRTFLTLRVEGSNANLRSVMSAAQKAVKYKTRDEIAHYTYNPMRGWSKGGVVPRREIGSVLWGEESACLPADVAKFLASEREYLRRGQTWKRVYLLHGPPGGGKSSAIKAIASSINANVYILSCKGMAEGDLADAISRVEPGSILVTEEVDGVWSAREEAETDDALRVKAGGGEALSPLTLEALLQATDGITTPHGMIWFMTTNHRDKLSPRLTRSRRIDKAVYFGPATEAQIRGGEELWGVTLPVERRHGLIGQPMSEVIDALQDALADKERDHDEGPGNGPADPSYKQRPLTPSDFEQWHQLERDCMARGV